MDVAQSAPARALAPARDHHLPNPPGKRVSALQTVLANNTPKTAGVRVAAGIGTSGNAAITDHLGRRAAAAFTSVAGFELSGAPVVTGNSVATRPTDPGRGSLLACNGVDLLYRR